MYVVDNERQREKMSHEFYVALKKEIETYQERACLLYTSRRHVQNEVGPAAYGIKPYLHKFFRGFDAGCLSLVPEPAGMVDRCV